MDGPELIGLKLQRLAQGEPPRVLDLFAGCGGLSLGLRRAGFAIAAGIEKDPHAAASHARNLLGGAAAHATPRDLTDPTLTPEHLCAALALGPPAMAVDVVAAGPPCQAFARVGRAKLRAIARDWPIFARMRPGNEYPAAHRIAETIFAERLAVEALEGWVVPPATARWEELRKATVPPYPLGTFPNRWWKLDPDRPVRTLMAHLGKDSYSHIHYDQDLVDELLESARHIAPSPARRLPRAQPVDARELKSEPPGCRDRAPPARAAGPA